MKFVLEAWLTCTYNNHNLQIGVCVQIRAIKGYYLRPKGFKSSHCITLAEGEWDPWKSLLFASLLWYTYVSSCFFIWFCLYSLIILGFGFSFSCFINIICCILLLTFVALLSVALPICYSWSCTLSHIFYFNVEESCMNF